ncbi:hypothetical protein ACFQZ4_12735 [Catellatospora coxensis]
MSTGSEVMAARTYPFSDPDRLNLNPLYEQLRRSEPLTRVRLPYGEEAWLATRYDDVRMVLGDARFSRAASVGRDEPRTHPHQGESGMLAMDPPEHTRLRKLIAKAFTARRVETLRPRTQEIANQLLDDMARHGSPPTWSSTSPPRCPWPSSASCSACRSATGTSSSCGPRRSSRPPRSPRSRSWSTWATCTATSPA